MLTLEQKQTLFMELHNAIRKNNADEIIKLLKDVSSEDQVWVLTARCKDFPQTQGL